MYSEFIYGLKRGYPVALGYLPVAFTFGLMAVSGGLPVWIAVFISMSNLTSAGQFAGTNLILSGAGLLEITLTTFIINIRYMLMSLSLSQRVEQNMTLPKRLVVAFGITDETFSVASMEQGSLSFPYFLGLISGPFAGWSMGTALGAMICSALPSSLSNAMGIALYAMFLAIIIPSARESRAVAAIILLSASAACLLRYLPVLCLISPGFRVILATFLGAGAGAYFFPADEREDEKAKHSSGWTDGESRVEERTAEIQNAEITDLKKEEGRSCI
ncbi:4-azaleucine resistance transporter AzlC [Anaerotaenia torta]|uniref:AzlC family ABC transporter permease n=1 Tax=Anaerotaenia torta TaxID=433293 RepID=UPI003D1A4562